MTFCPTCDEWVYPHHKCPPAWDVWTPEDDHARDFASKVYACDEESAAAKWAEDYDAYGDYVIVSGSEITVHVAPHEDRVTPVRVFVVSGESEPVYYASEVPS